MGAMEGSKLADDPFDFLSPDGPAVDEPVIPPPAVEPVTPPTETPVEPVAVEPAVVPLVTPQEPTIAPVAAPPGFVPLAALLDERDQKKVAKDRIAELERQQTAPVKQPTITDDPEGWQAARDAEFAQFRLDQTMEMSGRYAAQHFGADKVLAAREWGLKESASDPYFGQRFVAQADPFGWLVEQHRQATTLGMLGKETPEEWAIKYAASMGYAKPSGESPVTQQPPAVATAPVQPTPPIAPPKSIAGATPAGGSSTPVTLQEQEVAEFWSK